MAGAATKKGIEFIYFHLTDDIEMLDHMILELSDRSEVVFNRIRADIGKKQGYFMKWGNQELIRFAYNYHFHKEDYDLINQVVEYLLGIEYFDNKAYTDHGILTSTQIQNHYFSVLERRVQIDFNPEYLCPGIEELITKILTKKAKKAENKNQEEETLKQPESEVVESPLGINVNSLSAITPINVDSPSTLMPENVNRLSTFTPENVNSNRQRKGKESKVNESKEEERKDSLILRKEEFTETDLIFDSENSEILFDSEKPPELPPEPSPEAITVLGTPIAAEKKESSAVATLGGKKQPHAARDSVIRAWEIRFQSVYTSDFDPNVAIKHICRHLENIVRAKGFPIEQCVPEILKIWDHILSRWDLLDEYYSKQITFVSIKKNLENIINQIREREKNGGSKNNQSNERPVSGSGKVPHGMPFNSRKRT